MERGVEEKEQDQGSIVVKEQSAIAGSVAFGTDLVKSSE